MLEASMHIGSSDLLIVIDVQNDFCAGGALAVADGEAVIPVIHRVASKFENIVLTQDWHPRGHLSFASSHTGKVPFDSIEMSYGLQTLWPDHCLQASHGAALHSMLNLPKAELILRKGFRAEIDSYSAFYENDRETSTGLAGYVRERGFTRVFLAGLAYDYCVGFTALDAKKIGLEAVIVRDASKAIDFEGSVAEMEQTFDRAGVIRFDSESVLA